MPNTYVAKAVHFDGATSISNMTLQTVDGINSTYVFWAKFDARQYNVINEEPAWVFGVDPLGGFFGSCSYGVWGTSDQNFAVQPEYIQMACPNDGPDQVNSTVQQPPGVWVCVMGSIIGLEGGSVQLYFNDQSVGARYYTFYGTTNNVFNGVPFVVGDCWTGAGAIMDMADFRMWTDRALDFSDVNTRRLFIDDNGLPVDPAISVTQIGNPSVFFTGDITTFTENLGTGGPFSVNYGALANATTGPSDGPVVIVPGTVTMVAPYPYFQLMCSSGTLYIAGGDSLIRDVQSADIPDCITAGCTVLGTVGSYVAQAVHFDGNTWLRSDALNCRADVVAYLSSKWVKWDPATFLTTSGFLVCDPDNTYRVAEGPQQSIDNWNATFVDATGYGLRTENETGIPSNTWAHVLTSAKINFIENKKRLQIYINDVPLTYDVYEWSNIIQVTMNGLPYGVAGDDYNNVCGDVADVVAWFDVDLDISVVENRRLFIDANGKPVNPMTAVGQLGSPVLLFSGDASTFGNNRGTGGSFYTVGTLTNATTSPSD